MCVESSPYTTNKYKICHLSPVQCPLSRVTCHISHVMCYRFQQFSTVLRLCYYLHLPRDSVSPVWGICNRCVSITALPEAETKLFLSLFWYEGDNEKLKKENGKLTLDCELQLYFPPYKTVCAPNTPLFHPNTIVLARNSTVFDPHTTVVDPQIQLYLP